MIIKKENVKKKKSMSKFLVPFIVASIFIFTGAAMLMQYKTGMELSSTLVACFFTFMGSELAMLAGIKRTKIKNDYNNHHGGFHGGIFPFSESETETETDDGSVG